MIGWVQALAFSAFGIAVAAALAVIVQQYLAQRHERRKMQMEQDYEMIRGVDDE